MRTEQQWWDWHDKDSSRWSPGEDPDAATADAEERCARWVAGDSDDGPEPSPAPSREEISRELYRAALAAGAVHGYSDCPGGGLIAPAGASPECEAAVAAYRRHEVERYSYVRGPELREYYGRAD